MTLLLPGISSTTVYQHVGQLYIQLLFQQIIIFINTNFTNIDSFFYQSRLHLNYDNTTYTGSKGDRAKWYGQNGTGKMVAISIDFNSIEMDFHSATTSHKL